MQLWKGNEALKKYLFWNIILRKRSPFQIEAALKSSSPEKADVSSIVFLETIATSKSSTSGRVTVLEKRLFWQRTLFKKQVFSKIWCFVEKKFQKRNHSIDIDILSKFVFLNSNCSEKQASLKDYLFSRSSCSVEVSFWKITFLKE